MLAAEASSCACHLAQSSARGAAAAGPDKTSGKIAIIARSPLIIGPLAGYRPVAGSGSTSENLRSIKSGSSK
jgi:hypothetical protein